MLSFPQGQRSSEGESSKGNLNWQPFISRAAKGSKTNRRVPRLSFKLAAKPFARPSAKRQLPVLTAEAGLGCPLGMLMYPTTLSFPIWLTTSSRGTRVPRV